MRTNPTLTLVAAVLALLVCTTIAHAFLLTPVPPADATVTDTRRTVTILESGNAEPLFGTLEIASQPAQTHTTSFGPYGLLGRTFSVVCRPASIDARRTGNAYRFMTVAADTASITFEHVWARPTAGAASTGAAYFTVTNNGEADQLVGASTPIAAMAGVHETINDHGVMKMRPVASIALAPGKPVTLKPGGYHVMLTGLKSPLKAGDSFPLTLNFAHAQPVTVMVKVGAMGGGGMDHGAMPGMH
jgi:copper(I)-binding protein